jgi:RNA polymerase sigma-70 factor (ECF subfamily)
VTESDPPGQAGSLFQEWYAAQYPTLLRSLILVTGHGDVAVEATCEAFARALERWDRVSAMESPTGWTYRVALNVARHILRRARMEALLLRREQPLPPADDDRIDLRDAVAALPRRQRTAIVLHYLADLPQREVAAVMGVSEGTVAATLHAARRRLAAALGERAPGPQTPAEGKRKDQEAGHG